MNSKTNPILKADASEYSVHVEVWFDNNDYEAAEKFMALAPKSSRVRISKFASWRPAEDRYRAHLITVDALLKANAANGGENESGVRRVRAAVKAWIGAGAAVEIERRYVNSLPAAETITLLGIEK